MAKLDEFKTLNETELSAVEGGGVVGCVLGTAGFTGMGFVTGAAAGTVTIPIIGTVSGAAVGTWSGAALGVATFCGV